MEYDLDWVVEQQRYALEDSSRTVHEELRCEIGSLRQQLRYAEIRENILARSVREHYQDQEDLMRQLLDADLQKFQYKYQTVTPEDDLSTGQQSPCKQHQDVIAHDRFLCLHKTLPEMRWNQDKWIEEQQRLYRQYQNEKDEILVGIRPRGDFTSQNTIQGEDPPPYEEQNYVSPSRSDYWRSDHHEQPGGDNDDEDGDDANRHHRDHNPIRPPQVRFADPLEVIVNPKPPSPLRKRKETKKQVVGLCRKRSSRTAVNLLALMLT